MAEPKLPSTMRAWQYWGVNGGLEKNLHLNSVPPPKPKDDEHLVKVIAACLNPIDYKVAEFPIVGRFVSSKPATPGLDFAGRIVRPAAGSDLKPGQLIWGVSGSSPFAGAALREYSTSKLNNTLTIPENVKPVDAAAIPVAGLTAYQSLIPHVKSGSNVFINGGSGGTGTFSIQLAKQAGCHVTTTCSTPNIEFCRSLGADEVIDYKTQNIVETLLASGRKYDHAVDNVGTQTELLWRGHEFLQPNSLYIVVGGGGGGGASRILDQAKRKLLPKFLGGLKTNVKGFWPSPKPEDLKQIVDWIAEGKIKAVIDSQFKFEDVPQAIERLKTSRAKGKIVVNVSDE